SIHHGEYGRGRGRIIQRTKKWASAEMGAEVRRQAVSTLDLISGTSILLDSLGGQAGLRRNLCPWMAWELRKR
ncbi:mCG1045537, partial [Mus musculus]